MTREPVEPRRALTGEFRSQPQTNISKGTAA